MERDVNFAARVREARLLIAGIREAALAARLQDFHEGVSKDKEGSTIATGSADASAQSPVIELHPVSSRVVTLRRWLVAASIAAVIGVAAWLLVPSGQDRAFDAYYQKDPGLISAMGISDHFDFDDAMIDYKKGDYDKAIASWEKLSAAAPLNDTLNYFLGSAWLAKKNSSKAIGYFRRVLPVKNSQFLPEANWYLGLCLIKEGKKQEAIPYLQQSDRMEKTALIALLSK